MHWASSLALSGCKHSTVRSYLAGIRSAAIMQGFDVTCMNHMHRLKLVLRALKHIAPATATRLPITNDILLRIRSHMQLHTYTGKMYWAAFTFAHACLMRCGEFTASSYKDTKYLRVSSLKWEEGASHGTITLPSSKTSKQPVDIYLFPNNSDTCPVKAMVSYMNARFNRRYATKLD
jgi:hypothetical protein